MSDANSLFFLPQSAQLFDRARCSRVNTTSDDLAGALWNTTEEVLEAVLSVGSDFVADGLLDSILERGDSGAEDWRKAQASVIAVLKSRVSPGTKETT